MVSMTGAKTWSRFDTQMNAQFYGFMSGFLALMLLMVLINTRRTREQRSNEARRHGEERDRETRPLGLRLAPPTRSEDP